MATSKSVKAALSTKSKSSTTRTYKSKHVKTASKKETQYITNSRVPHSAEKLSPKNKEETGITNAIDRRLHYNLNLISGKGVHADNVNKYFDRLYSVYPQYEMSNLCQYVFIVRPDLNILTGKKNKLVHTDSESYLCTSSPHKDTFFKYMRESHMYLMNNISGDEFADHDFMPFLVGKVNSINVADYTLKDYKLTQPYSGYNLPYASHAFESETGGTFEITFREDGDFRVHKLFTAWIYYISGLMTNKFSPKKKYIRQNRFDYMCSVYTITCKADASEIVYFNKYTGAFPTSVPHSDASFNRGSSEGKKDVTIPFTYFRQEALDPFILIDFNRNSHVTSKATKMPYIPIYRSAKINDIGFKDRRDKDQKSLQVHTKYSGGAPVVLGSGNGLVGAPFICKIGRKYYLRWKTIKNLSP